MHDFPKEELQYMADRLNIFAQKCQMPLELKTSLADFLGKFSEAITAADANEYKAICTFNENGKKYLTLTSNVFACGSYASLDMAYKIINALVLGQHKFKKEWIDKIIFKLEELKNDKKFYKESK